MSLAGHADYAAGISFYNLLRVSDCYMKLVCNWERSETSVRSFQVTKLPWGVELLES